MVSSFDATKGHVTMEATPQGLHVLHEKFEVIVPFANVSAMVPA